MIVFPMLARPGKSSAWGKGGFGREGGESQSFPLGRGGSAWLKKWSQRRIRGEGGNDPVTGRVLGGSGLDGGLQ